MGARLVYAKVIDSQLYVQRGAEPSPGLENRVVVHEEPGEAAIFHVLRAWTEDEGAVTERWTIEGVGGAVLYESAPREIHFPTARYVEHLDDEVVGLKVDYAADDYNVVLYLDDIEVARVTFPVEVGEPPSLEA